MQEHLSQRSWGTSSSWYVDVFTNVEALQTPHYWDFYGIILISRHDQLTPFPALLPFLEKWGWG